MVDRNEYSAHWGNGKPPVPRGPEIGPPCSEVCKQIESMISAGCTLRTASRMLGFPPAVLQRVVERDAEFREAVLAAEARFEIRQLQRLDEAAKDVKNWRVSMWLLERRLPDRYGRQRPRTVREGQVEPLLRALARAVVDAVDDPQQQNVLFERLEGAVRDLETSIPRGPKDDGP